MLRFVVFCLHKFIAFADEFEREETQKKASKDRASLLDPNADSMMKIERYTFTLSQTVTLGIAQDIEITSQPDTTIRVQRRFSNVPCPGFVLTTENRVANLYVNVGQCSTEDEYVYANGGMDVDWPTMVPANKFSVKGRYTGIVPDGFKEGDPFTVCFTLVGPSTIC
jgi:hypothetical protein